MSRSKINRKSIIKDLVKSIPELDDKGLAFIYKQVQVIKHNMEIDKFNEQIEKQNKEILAKKKKNNKKGSKRDSKKQSALVEVKNSGNNFVIVFNNSRKHFSRDELRKLVNICHISKNQSEGSQMLFRWLKRERSDVLMDAGISGSGSLLLTELRKILKTNYKAKK
jgi:hypothetical protein